MNANANKRGTWPRPGSARVPGTRNLRARVDGSSKMRRGWSKGPSVTVLILFRRGWQSAAREERGRRRSIEKLPLSCLAEPPTLSGTSVFHRLSRPGHLQRRGQR